MTREKEKAAAEFNRRYRRLCAQLGRLGPVLTGTITERKIVREDPCQKGKMKTYGPYCQWTFKQTGKTKTVNLSLEQVKEYQQAIENHRQMEIIIKQMREVSLQFCEATTVGVKRKKSK